MAIRPPRQAPRRRSRHRLRDAIGSGVVATMILLFGLRAVMALLGVDTWTSSWEIVAFPTYLVIGILKQIDILADPIANHLTPAEVVAFIVVTFAGLTWLSSLALRRE